MIHISAPVHPVVSGLDLTNLLDQTGFDDLYECAAVCDQQDLIEVPQEMHDRRVHTSTLDVEGRTVTLCITSEWVEPVLRFFQGHVHLKNSGFRAETNGFEAKVPQNNPKILTGNYGVEVFNIRDILDPCRNLLPGSSPFRGGLLADDHRRFLGRGHWCMSEWFFIPARQITG